MLNSLDQFKDQFLLAVGIRTKIYRCPKKKYGDVKTAVIANSDITTTAIVKLTLSIRGQADLSKQLLVKELKIKKGRSKFINFQGDCVLKEDDELYATANIAGVSVNISVLENPY